MCDVISLEERRLGRSMTKTSEPGAGPQRYVTRLEDEPDGTTWLTVYDGLTGARVGTAMVRKSAVPGAADRR